MILKNKIKLREPERRAIAKDVQQFRRTGGVITKVPSLPPEQIRPIGKVYGSERFRFDG